jgi:hypothetical protein
MDESLFNPDELIGLYHNVMQQYTYVFSLMEGLVAAYNDTITKYKSCKGEVKIDNAVKDWESSLSNFEQQYSIIETQRIELETLYKLTTKRGVMFTQLLPSKQSYAMVMMNLCSVIRDAEKTENLLGFVTREQYAALQSGYDQAIASIQSYSAIFDKVSPATAKYRKAFVDNVIKKLQADKMKYTQTMLKKLFFPGK